MVCTSTNNKSCLVWQKFVSDKKRADYLKNHDIESFFVSLMKSYKGIPKLTQQQINNLKPTYFITKNVFNGVNYVIIEKKQKRTN
jgi:hypothetical protein